MNHPTSHRVLLIICIVLSVPLLCIGVFAAGHYYGQWQMDAARADVLEVATMLGYEPSAHLFDSVEGRNASLVDGSRDCVTILLYTTPLTASEFTQRLKQLPWQSVDKAPVDDWSELYMSIDLTVNGVHRDEDPEYGLAFIGRDHRNWDIKSKALRIYYYDLSVLGFPLAYDGKPFTKSVVRISVSPGNFPVWVYCPVERNLAPN